MPSFEQIIEAVKTLTAKGPVTCLSGRPCPYDVAKFFGVADTTSIVKIMDTLASERLLVRHPAPNGPGYPPEYSIP